MAVTFKLKIKAASGFSTSKVSKDGKEISQLVTTSVEQDVAGLVGSAVLESVAQHNRRVIAKAAIFFQRAVSRTPKDETYYDNRFHIYHKADDDDVWKHWKLLYWRREVTAEQMGLSLFDKAEDFNNKAKINSVINFITDALFGGEANLAKRKTKIRSIRIENNHPRFAMLEYGGYEGYLDNHNEGMSRAYGSLPKGNRPKYDKYGDKTRGMAKIGEKYVHGIVGGYSYQAPMGMLRITQAEIMTMRVEDFDKWFSSNYKRNTKDIQKVPSAKAAKKILGVIKNQKNLSDADIDAIMKTYESDMRLWG